MVGGGQLKAPDGVCSQRHSAPAFVQCQTQPVLYFFPSSMCFFMIPSFFLQKSEAEPEGLVTSRGAIPARRSGGHGSGAWGGRRGLG